MKVLQGMLGRPVTLHLSTTDVSATGLLFGSLSYYVVNVRKRGCHVYDGRSVKHQRAAYRVSYDARNCSDTIEDCSINQCKNFPIE